MKCRVVYKPDGTVSVIHPSPKSRKLEETLLQWQERVFARAMELGGTTGCEYEDIEKSALPTREDRDAWTGNKQTGLKVDQQKAKANRREKLIRAEAAKIKRDEAREKAITKLQGQGKID